ncbi:hypothetical protein [Streptomyces phaeochromogenes]|nr:hypothetical protein OHB08_25185 [Streptomyces phaeochromogenes]
MARPSRYPLELRRRAVRMVAEVKRRGAAEGSELVAALREYD